METKVKYVKDVNVNWCAKQKHFVILIITDIPSEMNVIVSGQSWKQLHQ